MRRSPLTLVGVCALAAGLAVAGLAIVFTGATATRAAAATAGSPAAAARTATIALTMPHTYLPQRRNGATDDYRCFVLDPKLARDVFVVSAHIAPGQPSLVHHVILFKESGAGAAAALRKDRETKGGGWTCFGGPGLGAAGETSGSPDELDSAPWLSAWVPGRTTDALPAGIGVLLPKGSLVVMQIHYNLLNGARADRSRVELGVRPATAKLAAVKTLLLPAPIELPCPVGSTGPQCERGTILTESAIKYGLAEAFIPVGLLRGCDKTLADYPPQRGDATDLRTSCDQVLPRDVTIRGVAGHMHLRGHDIRVTLVRPSGEEQTLLHIPDWDFHWQDVYYLARPVAASAGDTLRVSCSHDNSPSNQPIVDGKPLTPRYVLWGEGSTDEMCLGIVQVTER